MTCEFLEKLTLKTLIAPASEEEFRARYWEQEPLVVHRGNPDYYGDLFTLQDFEDAILRTPDYVKMANAVTDKNKSYRAGGVQGLEAVLADMRDNGTLVLDQLHRNDPNLQLLCRKLASELGHRFQTNLYLTPPRGKGFSPHWDNHDVFILQVLGSKHWKIEKERRAFPRAPDETMPDEGRDLQGELTTFTLEQGDIIYIPRGFVHAAECGSDPSLHITLGFTAVFFDEILYAIIKAAILRDKRRLGAALPLGFMRGSGKGLVDRAMAALLEAADSGFVSDVVEQFKNELVKTYPLDVSGQIVEFFQPKPLTVGDVFGAPRGGIIYRMHDSENAVGVHFGARKIDFLKIFRDALKLALSGRTFAIRDLPGGLQDEEKIAFTERLMQEGLVVRK